MAPDFNADTDRVRRARIGLRRAVEELSNCDRALQSPIADWLVTVRDLIYDMRQFDGPDLCFRADRGQRFVLWPNPAVPRTQRRR